MNSPSPASSISSGRTSSISIRNGPHQSEYLKPHKNITLSYAEGANNFQQGDLGDSDTFLVGTIHLNYQKSCPVKSIHLHLKGIEKTSWQKSQARSKYVYSGEHTLVDQTNKVWEAYEEAEEITILDIPFKVQLPYNLPDTVTTEIGSVQYVLKVTVNTKSLIGTTAQQMIKINCPLKRTIVLEIQSVPPYKLSGETPGGIDYTFILPPNKSFNLGSYVSIPMKLKFLKPNVGIEKLEVLLRTSMDFQSTTSGESKHIDQQIIGLVVPRSELLYVQPLAQQNHDNYGECTNTINLFVPKKVQPTYQGRFIGISHFLSIKFCLWGYETDFQVEESVRIAHIVEKGPDNSDKFSRQSLHHSNSIGSISLHYNNSVNSTYPRNITQTITRTVPTSPPTPPPSLPHRHIQSPPPIHSQYPYMTDHSIENNYYQQQHYQAIDHINRKKPTQAISVVSEHPSSFYDRPYDGYTTQTTLPQLPPLPKLSPLNYSNSIKHNNNNNNNNNIGSSSSSSNNNNNNNGQSESSGTTSRTSSRSEDIETSSNTSVISDIFYPTHLSPPPYRQTTRPTEVISSDGTSTIIRD